MACARCLSVCTKYQQDVTTDIIKNSTPLFTHTHTHTHTRMHTHMVTRSLFQVLCALMMRCLYKMPLWCQHAGILSAVHVQCALWTSISSSSYPKYVGYCTLSCRNLCISSERPRHRHRRHFSECSQGFATPFYIQGAMKNCVVNSYFFARPIQEGVERKLLDVTSKSRYNLNFWNPHVKSLRLVYIWVQSEGRGG